MSGLAVRDLASASRCLSHRLTALSAAWVWGGCVHTMHAHRENVGCHASPRCGALRVHAVRCVSARRVVGVIVAHCVGVAAIHLERLRHRQMVLFVHRNLSTRGVPAPAPLALWSCVIERPESSGGVSLDLLSHQQPGRFRGTAAPVDRLTAATGCAPMRPLRQRSAMSHGPDSRGRLVTSVSPAIPGFGRRNHPMSRSCMWRNIKAQWLCE